MNEELIKAQDVFLSKINRICSRFGLNNIMAQLYAILYVSNNPMSLNDMFKRLKISKASVSINIRALERYGAVRKVWVKGSRKDYYEAESDIYKVIMDRVNSMARSRLSELDDMVSSSYQALDSVNPTSIEEGEEIKVFKERLDKLKRLQDKAQAAFKLFNSGLLNNIFMGKNKKDNSVTKVGLTV